MNVFEDTLKHIDLVRLLLKTFARQLQKRGDEHDLSKLESPEREMYKIFRPKLDTLDIQSAEYKQSLAEMGEGLRHHYAENRHHPEHFANGIRGMNLIDLCEMVCDWSAAASRKGQKVNMAWASQRFGIDKDDMLYAVIANTIDAIERGEYE